MADGPASCPGKVKGKGKGYIVLARVGIGAIGLATFLVARVVVKYASAWDVHCPCTCKMKSTCASCKRWPLLPSKCPSLTVLNVSPRIG
eukprot:scaffold267649_cov28-Tisochrysis_lutea.AAC.1